MGASNSSIKLSPEQVEAAQSFSEQASIDMRNTFASVAGNADTGLDRQKFVELLHLGGSLKSALCQRLFEATVGQPRKPKQGAPQLVYLPDLVLLKYLLESSSPSEQTTTIWSILQQDDLAADLELWIPALVQITQQPPPNSDVLLGICRGFSDKVSTLQDFQKAVKKWPGILQLFAALVSSFPSGKRDPAARPRLMLVPAPESPQNSKLLMGFMHRQVLASIVPNEQRLEWNLLFNSDIHGKSFSSFVSRACDQGPTLMVVRDKKGHVFGGYAADPWTKRGSFYGEATCFLFQLLPTFSVYFTSGINSNYQWCGYNFKELPNGLGFGGQEGYFSMFVHEGLDTGMSRPAATFASPCLASSETFEVDCVELWEVDRSDEVKEQLAGCVMDRNKVENFLMELNGTVMHSVGYRGRAEPPIETD